MALSPSTNRFGPRRDTRDDSAQISVLWSSDVTKVQTPLRVLVNFLSSFLGRKVPSVQSLVFGDENLATGEGTLLIPRQFKTSCPDRLSIISTTTTTKNTDSVN